MAAGYHHTCALRDGGSVECWGEAAWGKLGNDSDTGNVTTPLAVSGITDAIVVEAGANNTCALRATGGVMCWGANHTGQIGDNTTTHRLTPVAVSGLSDAKQIAVGYGTTCAVRQSGAVVCWGEGDYGKLGNGSTNDSYVPTAVSNLSDAVQVASSIYNGCALRAGGSVMCWGTGAKGALGNGVDGGSSLTPTAVSNLSNATQMSHGFQHTCAWTSTGGLVCWGRNYAGQIGDGTTDLALTPTAVLGL